MHKAGGVKCATSVAPLLKLCLSTTHLTSPRVCIRCVPCVTRCVFQVPVTSFGSSVVHSGYTPNTDLTRLAHLTHCIRCVQRVPGVQDV